jgi:hypothetical protein
VDRFRRHFVNPLTAACWLVATVIASMTGPFGTYFSMPPELRIIYWAAIIGLSILVAFLIRVVIVDVLPPLPRRQRDMLMPVVFTVLFSPMLIFVNHSVLGWDVGHAMPVWALFLFNAIVAGAIIVVRRKMRLDFVTGPDVERGPDARAKGDAGFVVPRLYGRLSGARGRILRLTVDDHYVLVTMEDGAQHRLLMRFGDAVAEMEGQDGFLTHRSHWVSADAVLTASRASGRDVVLLRDGSVVPVSRTYRRLLESRGVIAAGPGPEPFPSE